MLIINCSSDRKIILHYVGGPSEITASLKVEKTNQMKAKRCRMKTLSQILLALELEEGFHEQTKGRVGKGWEKVGQGEESHYYRDICNSDNKNKVKR